MSAGQQADRGASRAPHEFRLGDHAYRCAPLEPLEQVHVARRLAPVILAALKPEEGRKEILARLLKLANLSSAQSPTISSDPSKPAAEQQKAAVPPDPQQIINDSLDLATSVFSAAAAADEEMVNAIIRKVMRKVARVREVGTAVPMWGMRAGQDQPTYSDVDGFLILSLVGHYLFFEFRDVIAQYIASLNLKPGPALMAAAGMQPRPPGAPGAI